MAPADDVCKADFPVPAAGLRPPPCTRRAAFSSSAMPLVLRRAPQDRGKRVDSTLAQRASSVAAFGQVLGIDQSANGTSNALATARRYGRAPWHCRSFGHAARVLRLELASDLQGPARQRALVAPAVWCCALPCVGQRHRPHVLPGRTGRTETASVDPTVSALGTLTIPGLRAVVERDLNSNSESTLTTERLR